MVLFSAASIYLCGSTQIALNKTQNLETLSAPIIIIPFPSQLALVSFLCVYMIWPFGNI